MCEGSWGVGTWGVFAGGDAHRSQEFLPCVDTCVARGRCGPRMGCRGERGPAVCGLVGPTRGSESLRGGWTKPPGWGLEPEGTELDLRPRCKVLGVELLLSGGTVCEDQSEEGKMEGDRNDAGMQEGERKKGEMGGNRRGGKTKNLVICHGNRQERNSPRDRSQLETGRLHKPKDMMENTTVPSKMETERGSPWGKDTEIKGWDSWEHKKVRRGSARTRLETNGDLHCRRMERHITSESNTGKESARPKAAGYDSWWPRGPEPRQTPLSMRGILQAGTLGRVAAPSYRGIFEAQESKPSLLCW